MNCLVTVESLESRRLLAGGPSAREQFALELINRARMNPSAELNLLMHSNNENINNALTFFQVNSTALESQWNTLEPVPPLAWNETLAETAEAHSQQMLAFDQQSHQLPGEPSLGERIEDAGYDYSNVGENIFATAHSIFESHAAFLIDWGNGPGGIQTPPGHRENLYSSTFREIGIGVIDTSAGKNSGPLLITHDLGTRFDYGTPRILGVAFSDATVADRFYTPGEGLDGIAINATRDGDGATFTTTTNDAGGYQIAVSPGTYTVVASGAELAAPITRVNVAVESDNVKADFSPALASDLPDVIGSIRALPKQLKPNAKGRVLFRLTNQGAPTHGVTSTAFFLSTDSTLDGGDTFVASLDTEFLLRFKGVKDRGVTFQAPLTLPGGDYFLIAHTDVSPEDSDSNVDNNTVISATAIKVIPPINNLIPTLSSPPKKLRAAGSTLPFALKVRNVGNFTATGTVMASFSLVSVSNPDAAPIELSTLPLDVAIRPGGSKSLRLKDSVPLAIEPGTYQLKVSISSELEIAESNLDDNSAVTKTVFSVPFSA